MQGQVVTVINTHGSQVVDTWAFRADDMAEFMSMEHSRGAMLKVNPRAGDTLLSNKRRPMLTILEDTSGGVHDTLIAACDRYRYEQLG
ncbi:urea carboxylase-associated family protein, partial [Mesorhizobium sp. BR1-1-7]